MIDTEIQEVEVPAIPQQKNNSNFFAMMFLGGLFSWLISFIVRIATGESLFARDIITVSGPVAISIGDLLIVSGFILGAAVNLFITSKKISFVTLIIGLVILLVVFSAIAR